MGFLDDAKQKVDGLAQEHPDQVESLSDQAIGQGGDAVDRATGGRYADQVDTAQAKADESVGEP